MEPITLSGFILALIIAGLNFRTKRGDIWKDEAEAQKARADRLESDFNDLRARVEKLESENAYLRDLATSHKAIEELAVAVAANHVAVMRVLESGN